TGAAYMAKYKKTGQVAVSFFGDGASNEGTFHESINMAAAWDLPVIYVLENNLYGISVDIRDVTNTPNLADRAIGYGIPGVIVDGMDVTEVYEAAKAAIERARSGAGPTLIECKTYRWQGHHVGDPATYRKRKSETEKEDWMAKCPIDCLKAEMLSTKKAKASDFEAIETAVNKEIEESVNFAKESPYPDVSEVFHDIYV
ncbi:MAG TPA: thiamine pyrophosphate-dependent enzyme, partial [Bacillota bacterium]|nr:thiamine pyrophosphate-dependent enzyme [Bacillota bacterium]